MQNLQFSELCDFLKFQHPLHGENCKETDKLIDFAAAQC